MPNPIVDDLDDLESLLLTAAKYEMQAIIDIHKKCFENRMFLQKDPLHLYAIACACELDDQAKYVARNAEFLTVVRRSRGGDPRGLTVASYRRLIAFLVERDNELHPILEQGWSSFYCCCDCFPDRELYGRTAEELKAPCTQMEDVYFIALKDRSRYYWRACGPEDKCSLADLEIREFLEQMFAEKERVCDKFIWKE